MQSSTNQRNRDAAIDRAWRVLSRLGEVWALVILVMVFTGVFSALHPLLAGLLVMPGLLAMLLHLVAFWADCSKRSTVRADG